MGARCRPALGSRDKQKLSKCRPVFRAAFFLTRRLMDQSSRGLFPRDFFISCHAGFGRRDRRIAQSSPAAIARPTQAVSASTAKSSNLACLPGAQSCRISIRPVKAMTKAAVSDRLRVGASPKASPSSRKASACSPFCPRFECGRYSAGPSVAKAMAAARPQANSRRMIVMRVA